ncbi:MAG: efflux transporter outer membrane subunit [Burkholderiales bacterium]
MSTLFIFTLAACSFTPEYTRPDLPAPNEFPQYDERGGGVPASEIAWREFFSDPRLQELIAQSLDYNRDLRVATARVEEARALYGIQRADRVPTVTADGSFSRNRFPDTGRFPGGTFDEYQLSANVVAYELDFWGRVRALNESALANFLATDEARRAFVLSLVSDVAGTYLTLRELDERITLSKQTLESGAQSRGLVDKRLQAGVATNLELLQADTLLQTVRAELANLERQRELAKNGLDLLVGNMPEGLPAPRSLNAQDVMLDLQPGIPSEVLTRRPDILAAEQNLIAENANIGAARAAFFPTITLTGGFGRASEDLRGLTDGGARAWNFLPQITLPIFDGGRRQSNLDLAEARKMRTIAEYERAIQLAFREVADSLASRQKLAEQLVALQENEQTQTERLRLAQMRYDAGVSNYLEVLDAQRELFTTQQNVVQVRRAQLANAVQLYKALGGGDYGNEKSAAFQKVKSD